MLTIAKPLFLYFDLYHLFISFKHAWAYHISKHFLAIPLGIDLLGIFKNVLYPSYYPENKTLLNISTLRKIASNHLVTTILTYSLL